MSKRNDNGGKASTSSRSGGPLATMADVAQLANVTTMTVSRALRMPEKVSAETREKIEKAIRICGFVPNYAARSLSSQHTPVIVALFPTMMNSVFSGTIEAISTHLHDNHYHLLLGQTNFDVEKEEELLAGFIGWRPAGIILTGGLRTSRTRKLLANADVPVVEVWNKPEQPFDVSVGFSNVKASYEMTRSLHEWGYRRVAFVSIDAPMNDRSLERLEGYRSAVAELGMANDPRLEMKVKFGVHAGREAMQHILENMPDVDAVFASSDTLAVGCLMEALRRGLKVPDDIAVAGFGDVELAAELVPSLTTVHVPRVDIGRRAASILIDRIAGSYDGPAVVDCGFEIVRRQSA
ncbi:LacI family DNA-binding transcriptional regulator [Mesorhizobium sp. 1B3]|uniref:LacI family DNA-binding transcriptional regulator n=1 Tax=Mesorhizobium sp. 1B3 TaxID=3243599 RepID=UPI003D960DEA